MSGKEKKRMEEREFSFAKLQEGGGGQSGFILKWNSKLEERVILGGGECSETEWSQPWSSRGRIFICLQKSAHVLFFLNKGNIDLDCESVLHVKVKIQCTHFKIMHDIRLRMM